MILLAINLWLVPCSTVRWYVERYSMETLEQMARSKNIVISDEQRKRLMRCLEKKK